jgi:uridine kinase
MARIIGIGGVSRSGKSTLAKKLKDHFVTKRVRILDQDDFVKPENDIPKIKDRTDWEHPESIDIQSLLAEIDAAEDQDLIIVEGLLAFHFEELRIRFDVTIFLTISKGTFLFRRHQETRWGTEPDWFIDHVWDSYLKYGQVDQADFQLDGENEISNTSFLELINAIHI